MQPKSDTILKAASFGAAGVLTTLLAAATIVAKVRGAEFAEEHIYTALPVLVLWGVAAVGSLLWLLRRKVFRRPAVFALHIALLLILAGALTTHLAGLRGQLHLREGEAPTDMLELGDGSTAKMPFGVSLAEFRTEYHEGTFAPSDFVSRIVITDGAESCEGRISMNNIFKYRHYRFYQSGCDADGRGTLLSVSHDPAGIAVTYTGYLLLLLSMAGFFFDGRSAFRALLHHPSLRRGVMAVLLLLPLGAGAAPRTLSREAAAAFCDMEVCYNDRICPVQTLAREFTAALCGKTSYKGLTAEQVLAGWFFYYDDWKREPVIKIKGEAVRRRLGIEGAYASLLDFTDTGGYKLDEMLRSADNRDAAAANAKFNLVSRLCTGSLLKIYPYTDPETGVTVWYSPADRPADDMPFEQWMFICGSMSLVAERIAMHDEEGAIALLGRIAAYQEREGGASLPSPLRLRAEKLYNATNFDRPLAMACMTAGIILFIIFCTAAALRRSWHEPLRRPTGVVAALLFAAVTGRIALRWLVAGHVPLSSGFETMQFMAWCALLLTLAVQRRFVMAQPFGLLVCGFALLVAMMGEASPRISNLIPVLQSPLLSLHVMVIMAAYALLAFTMLNGVTAAVLHAAGRRSDGETEYLATVSRILLRPAVFLLATGIFIGAVWANVSWGRYWGWDPKEVWALITMMVYAAALHEGSLPAFRRPMFFHIYCIAAFLTVLITYFGVNFILGGMHGYA